MAFKWHTFVRTIGQQNDNMDIGSEEVGGAFSACFGICFLFDPCVVGGCTENFRNLLDNTHGLSYGADCNRKTCSICTELWSWLGLLCVKS